MELTSGIWASLAAVGASTALAFIVTLILGIVLLSLLYLGSAIVVLERFARVSARPGWTVFFGLVVSAVFGLIGLEPEIRARPWPELGPVYLAASVRIAWSEDGDHSLKPRVRSGRTEAQNLAEAVRVVAAFVNELRA